MERQACPRSGENIKTMKKKTLSKLYAKTTKLNEQLAQQRGSKLFFNFFIIYILILLSRASDQCAVRARFGVAGHLSTTLRWRKSR